MPKRIFLFVTKQRGLSATCPASILTAFEIKDLNRCPYAYTGKRFPNFCAGGFTGPKQRKWVGLLSRGIYNKATAETAQFRAMGIVSGTSQHPKDVPFVSEFLWGRTACVP